MEGATIGELRESLTSISFLRSSLGPPLLKKTFTDEFDCHR